MGPFPETPASPIHQWMPGGGCQDELLTEEGTHLQVGVIGGYGDQRGVQPSRAQHCHQLLGLLLGQQQLKIREPLPGVGQDVRQ